MAIAEGANSQWVTVPREIAEKHPLYGIGGWMIVVMLRCASIPFTFGISLAPLYAAITTADHSQPLFGYFVATFVLRLSLVAWALANVFLIFARHHAFPRSYIGYILLLTALIIGETIAGYAFAPESDATTPVSLLPIGRAIGATIGGGIWIAYAIVSRRVNVTFLRRIRSDDPALRAGVAETF